MNYKRKILTTAKNLFKTHHKDILVFLKGFLTKKYIDEEKGGGAIIIKEATDPKDYGLSGADVANLPELKSKKHYIADQGREWRTRNACVPFNVIQGIHKAVGIAFTHEITRAWLNWAEEQESDYISNLWVEGEGAVIPETVNAFVKKWNESNPNKEIESARLYYTNPLLEELKKKGYPLIGGYSISAGYSGDRIDGVINDSDYANKARQGGHCTSLFEGDIEITEIWNDSEIDRGTLPNNKDTFVIDTYPNTKKNNVYQHNLYKDHSKNGIWYSWYYVIYEKNPDVNPDKVTADVIESEQVQQENMGPYEKQFVDKYGVGTIYDDLLGANVGIDRESLYFIMIGLERVKQKD